MTLKKTNCWEFNRCGREPGGANAADGVCPVSVETNHEGVNGGTNAGRHCWVVAGSFQPVAGVVECTQKKISCLFCEFFQQVEEEEGDYFVLSPNSHCPAPKKPSRPAHPLSTTPPPGAESHRFFRLRHRKYRRRQ